MSMRVPGNPPITAFGAINANPAVNALLVDSGPVPFEGIFEVRVMAGGDAAGSLRVEHRNAANAVTIDTVIMYTAAGQTSQLVYSLSLLKGERMRVACTLAITGNVAATLQLEHLG